MHFNRKPIFSVHQYAKGNRLIYSSRFASIRTNVSKGSSPSFSTLRFIKERKSYVFTIHKSLFDRGKMNKTGAPIAVWNGGWHRVWRNLVGVTDQRIIAGNDLLYMSQKNEKSDVDDLEKKNDGGKDKEQDDEDKRDLITLLPLYMMAALLMYAIFTQPQNVNIMEISWAEFLHELLAKGEVTQIKILKNVIQGKKEGFMVVRLHPGAVFKGEHLKVNAVRVRVENANTMEEKIREAESNLGISAFDAVPIIYQDVGWARDLIGLGLLCTILLLSYVTFRFVTRHLKKSGGGGAFSPMDFLSKPNYIRGDNLDSKHRTTFKEVAGLHEPKIEIMEFVEYLRHPERYKKLGAKIPKGVLLLGPPGCGKTLLAKALASEAGVPFLSMAGSNFVEMIGGLGAARVRSLFKDARLKSPCIIYIDEIDCIGKKRSMGQNSGSDEEAQTLNQMLTELDGMTSRDGILLLASTNRAEVLDKALTRPGRLDRHVMIDLPTLSERKEIYEMYLSQLSLAEKPEVYSERLAQLSPGKSGADIANICNEAALFAARHNKTVVDHEDFELAVEKVTAGVARKTKVVDPRERRVIAFHEAGHALMAWLQEHTDPLLKVSIVARTNATLGFSQYQPNNSFLQSKEELFERMCLALGGRVAESITFNRVTSMAQDDLDKVRKLAYGMIRVLGMNSEVGPLSFPIGDEQELGIKPYSKRLKYTIDQEASKLVAEAYQTTEKLILDNKDKLKRIAEALVEKETLNYKDIEQLIGPPPFGDKKVPIITWDELKKNVLDKSEEIIPPSSEEVKSSDSEELKS